MAGLSIPLDEVVHFDVVTHNPATGAVSDADSTPTFDVYEEATDTGLLGATNFTKRTSLTGNYRGTFTASAANGFEVGKWYNVIGSATVNSVAGKTVALTFMLRAAEHTAGYEVITVKDGTGTGEIDTTSGGVLVAAVANNAITASSIAADAITAAKVADGTIDAATFAAGAINAAAIATGAIDADALASDAVTEIRSLASGTSDSGSTTTMVDAARTEADTDYWKGDYILFTSGTISGQCRLITGFTPGTDTITFAPATTQAVSTQTYEILPAGRADVELWDGSAVNSLISGRVDANMQAAANDVITAAVIATDAIDSDAIAASAVTEIQSGLATAAALDAVDNFVDTEIADIQSRLPAALIGGRMDSNMQAAANGVITAAVIADNAIDTATFAAGTTIPRCTLVDTLTTYTGNTPQTGDSFARLGAPTGASIAADILTTRQNTDYPLGFVYLDSSAGSAGTTVGVNGTPRNPVNSWADANTIAVARGRKAVKAAPGGSIIISSGTFDNYAIDLNGGTLILDDSTVWTSTKFFSSSARSGAYETDVANPIIIGQACFVENLNINGLRVTHAQVYAKNCGFYDNIVDGTGAPSGTYRVSLVDCYNAKGTGDVTFALASGGHWLLEGWYGNLTITGMAAGQNFTVFGYGKLTIAASCTGGTIQHTSHIEILDQASGAVTTDLISEPGTVSGFTTAAKSEINTEVLDVMTVDTFAQPGQEAPAATTTLGKMLAYLYKAFRNKKTQTATERKLYADDGTTVDQKATDSDDGTVFTKGELGTGP